MKKSETAQKARSALAGNDLYQQRGRAALPILVRQVRVGVPITYGDLADELEMPNARNGNFVLGSAGRAVVEYGATKGQRLPPLTSIVVNKATRLPSDGVAEFLDRPDEYLEASKELRERIIDRHYAQMSAFEGWEQMLREMGLKPIPPLRVQAKSARGGGGEGRAHQLLKEYIARNPRSVGLGRSARVTVEASLTSGDRLDVLFEIGRRKIGVEVKAADADEGEVERGMFQCVKYEAVLRAMQRADQVAPSAESWLALGGALPRKLVALRNTLGLTVLENVGPDESGTNSST